MGTEIDAEMEEATYKGVLVFETRGLNGQEGHVGKIKSAAAVLFGQLDKVPIPTGNTEAGRMVAIAKTKLEESVMWGVKALSRNYCPTPKAPEIDDAN